MIDKNLNTRQKELLMKVVFDKAYSAGSLRKLLEIHHPSPATFSRDLKDLRDSGFLEQVGERKAARYTLTIEGAVFSPIDAHEYCSVDADLRAGATTFQFGLFEQFPHQLFPEATVSECDTATAVFAKRSEAASDTIRRKELERFVIDLSWKSSKIEGNTYTLLDTELLLKEGIEAPGHTREEATMIINHKKAFTYILAHKEQYQKVSIRHIEDVHRVLVDDLGVSFGLRSRPIGITGTPYRPLAITSQVQEALSALCGAIDRASSPYDKALIALLGISYIQPFEDGNKRTARLIANAILVAHHRAPLSYRTINERLYREVVLVFYEKQSVVPMRDVVKEQYLFSCAQYLA